MKMDTEDIKKLIDKYLDGLTSEDEERQLRTFFSRDDILIPYEWRVYMALFTFENHESQLIEKKPNIAAKPHSTRIIRHDFLIKAISVAASLIIIMSIFLNIGGRKKNYAVIDGTVTTNRETVNREAEAALEMVSSDEDDTFGALGSMTK
jgi:hypothetical protein